MERIDIKNKYKPRICKIALAASDFLSFNASLWLSLGVVYFLFNYLYRFIPAEQF